MSCRKRHSVGSAPLAVSEVLEPRRLFAVLPAVHVVALGSATGAEYRSQTAQVAINRPADSDTRKALTVHYALAGTARNSADYSALGGTAVIPAHRTYTIVTVTPLRDTLIEGTETVVFSIVPNAAYTVTPGETATLSIIDYPVNADWRAAPFSRYDPVSTIYVNQFGDATLPDQTINSLNGYDLYYDDGGPVTLTTSGTAATDLAYYEQVGQPGVVNDTGGAGNTTTLTSTVSADKDMDYVGVRPHVSGATGTYTLQVAGPAEGVPYPLDVSSRKDNGSSGSDISGLNDYDFYRFRIPRNGNWLMQATPTSKVLDVSMNVYDNDGNPIGGTFTSAIDNGGPGVTENFTAIGLQAGELYWIRVDGVGVNPGDYGVSVQIAPDVPDVSVTAKVPTATAGRHGTTGQFVVSRTDASPSPLTINYRVHGAAVPGVDYTALTGSVTIPANATSATINVIPLDAPAGGKSFVLSLYANAAFNLTSRDSASVTIAG